MKKNDSLVYLYGFSLRSSYKLENLLKILKEQSKNHINIIYVLIHDAVIGTSKKSLIPPSLVELLNLPMTIYVMIPDLLARGIDPTNLRNNIKAIGYEELVDILANTSNIVSWI
ncbi:MAG: DsrH/TusB family sulfur metabolism protein [Candidatus Hodarchaeota archaeon]